MNAFMTEEHHRVKTGLAGAEAKLDGAEVAQRAAESTQRVAESARDSLRTEAGVQSIEITKLREQYDRLVGRFGDKIDPETHSKLQASCDQVRVTLTLTL